MELMSALGGACVFGGAATGEPLSNQSRREHARVVDDQEIPRAKQRRQLGEAPMLHALARAVEHHQPAAAAFRRRLLGDQFVRKIEVKVGCQHKRKARQP